MIKEIDWRNACVILANDVRILAEMVRKAFPNNPEITDPLKDFEERCADIITTATIQKGRQ